jgi:hypothetical protein
LLQAIESPTKSPNEAQVTKEIVAWKAHFVSFGKQLTFLGVMHHCSNVVWVFFFLFMTQNCFVGVQFVQVMSYIVFYKQLLSYF